MIDALLALPDHVVLTLIVLVLVNVGLYVVAWTNDQKQKKAYTRAGRGVLTHPSSYRSHQRSRP